MKWVLVLLLVFSLSCSKTKSNEEGEGLKKADPKYQAIVEQFGNAIARKDYRSAYDLMSSNFQSKLSFNEFVETWQPYMDSFEGEVQAGYSASDDAQGMSEFVPEEDRSHLVEEVTIELSGNIDGQEEAFFCTTWIIDDGTPSIAMFYVED